MRPRCYFNFARQDLISVELNLTLYLFTSIIALIRLLSAEGKHLDVVPFGTVRSFENISLARFGASLPSSRYMVSTLEYDEP